MLRYHPATGSPGRPEAKSEGDNPLPAGTCGEAGGVTPGTPAELPDSKYFIFGENGGQRFAAQHDVPLLAQLPLVQSIRENGDQGQPAVLDPKSVVGKLFANLAEAVARQVSIRNNVAPKTAVVQMNP